MKVPRPASLPTQGMCVPRSGRKKTGWKTLPGLCTSGPLGCVHCCRHPCRLRNRSPLTLAAPGAPVDCTPVSPHIGGRGWARLPGWPLNPGFWPLGGRRDGKEADDHGSGVPSTLPTPLGVRNNSRSKKGRKQPLSSRGAASGPEVGA